MFPPASTQWELSQGIGVGVRYWSVLWYHLLTQPDVVLVLLVPDLFYHAVYMLKTWVRLSFLIFPLNAHFTGKFGRTKGLA